jgi:hypothetical protein
LLHFDVNEFLGIYVQVYTAQDEGMLVNLYGHSPLCYSVKDDDRWSLSDQDAADENAGRGLSLRCE